MVEQRNLEKLSKREKKRTWIHYSISSPPSSTFPQNPPSTRSSPLHPRPRANTWQLLNKFIIRLDARFRDSVGAPCFFQYIRAAIYSLQIVPNWQPATSYLRPTFVHAYTHTKSRLMGASRNDTPSSLTGWLSAHPLINWLHAPRPCVHRCNTRVYSQMYIRYNLPCSRFEHPCFSFIKRRFNCKSIPSNPRWGRRWRLASLLLPPCSGMYAEVHIRRGYFSKGRPTTWLIFEGTVK